MVATIDIIFTAWTSVVPPTYLMLICALTGVHAFIFTIVDNWL